MPFVICGFCLAETKAERGHFSWVACRAVASSKAGAPEARHLEPFLTMAENTGQNRSDFSLRGYGPSFDTLLIFLVTRIAKR